MESNVKMKNKDVIQVNESLNYLSQLNTPAWYGVGKNLRIIKSLVEEINKSRQDIVENLGKKDDAGNLVYEGEGQERKVVWEDEDTADKKWEELMNEEVKTPEFFKFSAEKFGEAKPNAMVISPLVEIIITD